MIAALPDAKRVVADYLRSDAAVAAITQRVRTTHPDTTDSAWVRVTLGDARQMDPANYSNEFYFQLDCYAGISGGQPQAADLAKAVWEAIVAINEAEHDGAVVSGGRVIGCHDDEDPDLMDDRGHSRARVIVTANVYMRA